MQPYGVFGALREQAGLFLGKEGTTPVAHKELCVWGAQGTGTQTPELHKDVSTLF